MAKFVPINGFTDYIISDTGIVKSLKSGKEHIMSPSAHPQGYRYISLSKNGQKWATSVHRLVCNHFIPNPENKPEVNHKNGIKSDNRVENLEWCTASENTQHSFDIGLNKGHSGASNAGAKLTLHDVRTIRKRLKDGEMHKSIARDYSVSRVAITNINRGHTWKEN